MGKTYRQEKVWGRNPARKIKIKKHKGRKDTLPPHESNQEDDYDDLELEAYEEEYNQRLRRKVKD